VTGYTDRLGEIAQNQQLANGRANSAARELKVPSNKLMIKGIGNAATFNQELPEGRLYTRTVDIVIQTPIR
jgi:outer membrane protein OmpA-like peptidoglycan-associated protein